jgi:hypothetical protein
MPLFDAAPRGDVVAFLRSLGAGEKAANRLGTAHTLEQCKAARDYAQPRAKKGGLVGYIIALLDNGWGKTPVGGPVRAICGVDSDSHDERVVPPATVSVQAALAMPDVGAVMWEEAQERREREIRTAETRRQILFAKENQWQTTIFRPTKK